MSAEGIISLLEAQGGAGSRRQLQEAGFSRRTVEAMVRRRELVSVRRDAVVLAAELVDATPWARRALEARAVGFSLAPATDGARDAAVHALSHESALMVHGLPYFGEDGLVHLVRTDGLRGRRDDTVWVHSPVDPSWVVAVEGLRVMRPVLAALQVAATHGEEAGLVALDGVLHEARLRDKDEVGRSDGPATAAAHRQIASALTLTWGPGTPVVRLVAEFSDGRSESAGESRSRWLLRLLGFGPTTLQFPVRDGAVLVGLADLKLDRWDVLIEFDGTGKYTGPGTLLAEKDREDRMRALGYEVVRLRWADLARPHLVRQRILAAIARAEARAATTG
ncbi:hypothetical protein [Ornithinimicrobium pratense]|uniref:DUF559 domain-containing protein n=1 Tax=Ornithinimicrobium pratense TaxID=2593973 RepID=A0A5J6V7I7_9MICO|nr:hypothetical protein [Ornithinimicrobium pratense]QFG69527.1 hypothetical protein FY030_13170 [Ornithinimicrobium pratense]